MSVTQQRDHRRLANELRPKSGAEGNVEIELYFEGFELVVRGDYTKHERQWFNPMKGIGHPGCPEDFDVNGVYLADSAIDVLELFDARALSIAVLEHMHEEAA